MNRAEKRRQRKLAEKRVQSGEVQVPLSSQQASGFMEMIALATQQYDAGDLLTAERACNKIANAFPNQPEGLHLLGIITLQKGKVIRAVNLLSRAVAIKPDYAEAHCNLGSALMQLGRLEGAITSLNKALAIKPDSVEAYYNLGMIHQAQDRLDDAISNYQKAISIKPDFAEAHSNLITALKNANRPEALSKAIDVAKLSCPNHPGLSLGEK